VASARLIPPPLSPPLLAVDSADILVTIDKMATCAVCTVLRRVDAEISRWYAMYQCTCIV